MLNLLLNTTWQSVIGWFLDDHGPRSTWNTRMSFFWDRMPLSSPKMLFREFMAAGKMYIFSCNAQTANITHVDKREFTRACLSSLCRDRTHGFRTRKGWLDVWQIVPCAPGPPDTHMTYIVCVFSALERQGVCWGEAYCAHTHSPMWEAEKGL